MFVQQDRGMVVGSIYIIVIYRRFGLQRYPRGIIYLGSGVYMICRWGKVKLFKSVLEILSRFLSRFIALLSQCGGYLVIFHCKPAHSDGDIGRE